MAKQTKTQTPAIDTTAVYDALRAIAVNASAKDSAQLAIQTANTLTQEAWQVILTAKIKIGNLKSCAFAQTFRDALCSMVNPQTGKLYPQQTASNYLTAMREGIRNQSKVLELNPSRAKKSVGQSATPAKKDKAKLTKDSAEGDQSEKSDKTTREKVLIQLENAVSILQSSEDADFDVVEIMADIKSIIEALN